MGDAMDAVNFDKLRIENKELQRRHAEQAAGAAAQEARGLCAPAGMIFWAPLCSQG